jgi:NADPH:quinone reductase-like Zn-dependent oxidoreductase
MKAVVCTRYGPPEVLRLVDVDKPSPRPDEVCIRVIATAVTSSDCYVRGLDLPFAYRVLARFALGFRAPRRRILGMVLAGQVESAGRAVTSFKAGDQVFGMDRHVFGAYAQFVCWPADGVLAARPASLTHAQAAALPYGGLLALHFLRNTNIRSGQRVLIYGASGAVGTSAVQLARHFGAEVTGVCSGANRDLVQSLGATTVIDYTREDFTTRAGTYDLIFDAVGRRKSSQALRHSRRVLTRDGTCVSVDDGTPKLLTSDLTLLRQLAETGQIRPVIDRCYRLDQIIEAHRYVDAGHKRGNVCGDARTRSLEATQSEGSEVCVCLITCGVPA